MEATLLLRLLDDAHREIGLIKVVAEMAIAAGTRRIEAVAGQPAYALVATREAALAAVSAQLGGGASDVVKKLESVLSHQKELERQLKAFQQKALAGLAGAGAALALSGIDLALWDIKGKVLGQPVARLIGGARSAVPAGGISPCSANVSAR